MNRQKYNFENRFIWIFQKFIFAIFKRNNEDSRDQESKDTNSYNNS